MADRRAGLWRTTPVRLAIIFSAIFATGIVTLAVIVYVSALGYLQHQGDEIVLGQASVLALSPPEQMASRIETTLRGDRRGVTYYGLFDPEGRRLAGNIVTLPKGIAPNGVPVALANGDYQPGARALVQAMPDGRLLFVGYDAKTLSGLREILMRALLLNGSAVLVAGLAIGLLFGLGPIRRLRAISSAIARVRSGELSARLPQSGRDDELDALVILVNDMIGEVERLLGEVKSVGDNLAHDLRTPLGHLRANMQQALDQLGSEDIASSRQRLAAALSAADILLARFQAIQRIAEIDARKRRAGITDFDLSALVTEFGELYDAVAEERQLALIVDAPPGIHMKADRELIAEALSNILDNAIKFTPLGGTVRLSVATSPQMLTIEVADTGPGIPSNERAHVTERFGRSVRDRNVPGAGLGLAIVAAVARLHDLALELGDANPGLIVRLRGAR